VRQQFKVNIP